MTGVNGNHPLDDAAFDLLRREIGDDEGCATFVQVYLDLLPQRLSELSRAVANGETEPWDAAINLAATTRMLGAMPLASHLERLCEDSIATRSPEAIRVFLRRLSDLAQVTQPALRHRVGVLRQGQAEHWRMSRGAHR
jgi:hypothetical protein